MKKALLIIGIGLVSISGFGSANGSSISSSNGTAVITKGELKNADCPFAHPQKCQTLSDCNSNLKPVKVTQVKIQDVQGRH